MKQKMIGSIEDVQAHPEKYRRVWTMELQGELVEGLWVILPMSLTTNFFLHYKNGELFLTDSNFDQEED